MSALRTCDVLVIGAGSVGLPLSYELARRGKKVIVLDKRASPGRGENRTAIGGIRATHSDPAKIGICRRSIEEVKTLEREHDLDVDWFSGGYLFPVYDEQREVALKKVLVVQKQHELNIDWIGPERVKELVPGISAEGLRGGTYSPDDGSASPLKVALAYYRLAANHGASFRFNEAVEAIEVSGEKITAVRTNAQTYCADVVVNAAGAQAQAIGALCGLEVPVTPDSHEAGITEPVQRFFSPMVVDLRSDDRSANYYFYQNVEGQVVFCITPKPKLVGLDADSTSEFLPLVVKRMVALYPRLRNLRVRRTWRGLYPMTPDGFPIVGWSEGVNNLMLAVGMCGQGFMLGPGLGIVLAETICETSDAHQAIFEQLSPSRDFESAVELLK